MSQAKAPPEADERPSWGQRLRAVGWVNWVMLALALLSIGLLSWEMWWPPDETTRRAILIADTVICAIFAVEFIWRMRQQEDRRGFVLRNWYEILGMIPAAHPALRSLRLLRVLRILVILARVGAAADRAMGEETTHRWLQAVRMRIVNALSGAITVAVLDEVGAVLQKGHYTQNIARALEENRPHLAAMLGEKLRHDEQLRRFSRLPFYGLVVDAAVAASLRVAHEALLDERTDELIADALRENLVQIRRSVWEQDAQRYNAHLPERQKTEQASRNTVHSA